MTTHISAKEARQMSDGNFDYVYAAIEDAAITGEESLRIDIATINTQKSLDKVIADLRSSGYTVEIEQEDQWKFFKISW